MESAFALRIGSESAEASGIRGVGSYVPRTSMGLESRAVLGVVSWDLRDGRGQGVPRLRHDDVV